MIILKNNHRKTTLMHLVAFVALLLCSCAQKADKAPTVIYAENVIEIDSLYKSRPGFPVRKEFNDSLRFFVIRGVDMQSPILSKGKFIWGGDLSSSGESDFAYDGITCPLTSAILTPHKKVLKILAGDVSTYIINGKESGEKDFDDIPGNMIQRAFIDGDRLLVDTRLFPDRSNPDIESAENAEGVAIQKLVALMKEKYGFDDIEEGSMKLGLPSPYALEQIYADIMRKNTNPTGPNL